MVEDYMVVGLAQFAGLLLQAVGRHVDAFGAQADLSDSESLVMASEEIGNYAREVNDVHFRNRRRDEMERELIEAAACLYRHWNRSRLLTGERDVHA